MRAPLAKMYRGVADDWSPMSSGPSSIRPNTNWTTPSMRNT